MNIPAGLGYSDDHEWVRAEGDVAFVGNGATTHSGAFGAESNIQFDGNVYFVGNMAGVQYNTPNGGIFTFNTGGGGSYLGTGGAIRIGVGGQRATFSKDAIFVGNLASAEGGAIMILNNSTMNFNGKAVFMGNMAGLWSQDMNGRGGGNGGAIVFSDSSNKITFNGESYFVANQASGFGGAVGESQSSNATRSSYFMFNAPALFTDNVSGFRPAIQRVYWTIDEGFRPPVNLTVNTGTETVTYAQGVPVTRWYADVMTNVFSGTNASGQTDYGGKVRWVFKNFPLRMHPDAAIAAEGALCAAAQNKFWEYHEILFATEEPFTPESLTSIAGNLGLDQAAFRTCLDTRASKSQVEAEIAQGVAAKVNLVPTFVINGLIKTGAMSAQDFRAALDAALVAQGKTQ